MCFSYVLLLKSHPINHIILHLFTVIKQVDTENKILKKVIPAYWNMDVDMNV